MKYLLITIVSIYFYYALPDKPTKDLLNIPKSKGSFIIAAMSKDGIVIGADTRGCFYDIHETDTIVYASYDPIQKIFQMGNEYMMGCIGSVTQQESKNWFYQYVDSFKRYRVKQNSLVNEATLFYRFLQTNYSSAYQMFYNMQLYFIGYQNNEPRFCLLQRGNFQCSSEYIVSDSKSDFDSFYHKSDSWQVVANLIERKINEFAKKYKREDFI
ncbi:MAG: hypothetical protein WBB17_14755, partial [Saprospiraceae bacterium]